MCGMGMRRRTVVVATLLSLVACAPTESVSAPPHPLDIAREHGSVAIVVQLDVPNRGSAGSPAWDPADIAAAQERLIDHVGALAQVTSRPNDVPNLGLRLGPRGVKRLVHRLVAGYYIDKAREPNAE